MSRYTEASCKLCRRETVKGSKCLTEKCPVERRAYPPVQHGQQTTGRGRKQSEYAKQLREKQKVKRMYGLSELQFRNLFEAVTREPGVKGTNLLVALETRLDNVVYRLGFASSRKAARQLVNHGHVEVNGRRVDIPSFKVLPGQEVRVAPASRENLSIGPRCGPPPEPVARASDDSASPHASELHPAAAIEENDFRRFRTTLWRD